MFILSPDSAPESIGLKSKLGYIKLFIRRPKYFIQMHMVGRPDFNVDLSHSQPYLVGWLFGTKWELNGLVA